MFSPTRLCESQALGCQSEWRFVVTFPHHFILLFTAHLWKMEAKTEENKSITARVTDKWQNIMDNWLDMKPSSPPRLFVSHKNEAPLFFSLSPAPQMPRHKPTACFAPLSAAASLFFSPPSQAFASSCLPRMTWHDASQKVTSITRHHRF